MSFDKKKIDEIHNVLEAICGPYRGQTLDQETISLLENLTVGDLIIEFGHSVDDAAEVLKNINIIRKKNASPGFSLKEDIKETRIIARMKKIIRECACDEQQMDDVETSSYHPMMDMQGGMRFEDSNPHEEAGMIKSNLYSIANKAQALHDMVGDSDDLPEWVQEKIAVCDEYMDVISDYLGYEYEVAENTHVRESKKASREYGGKKYSASKGSIESLKKAGGSTRKAVKSGAFDWADEPYAAAQAARIVSTGQPITKKGDKRKK